MSDYEREPDTTQPTDGSPPEPTTAATPAPAATPAHAATPAPATTSIPGQAAFNALDSPTRHAVVGATVVGVYGLLAVAGGGLNTGSIALVAGAVALLLAFGFGRGRWGAAGTAGLVLTAGAVVVVLGYLDLIWAVRRTDEPEDYGDIIGLVGRAIYLLGALLLAEGGWGVWRAARGAGGEQAARAISGAERLAAAGVAVLVIGWVLMMTIASGWTLVFEQAIGITAAIVLGGALVMQAAGALPIGERLGQWLVIGLAALVGIFAINSIVNVADEWDIVTEIGGPTVYLPYLVYIAGAAIIVAGGVLVALRTRSAPAS